MSASLTYATVVPLKRAERSRILSFMKRDTHGYQWWTESMSFYDDPQRPDHLVGTTKLFALIDDAGIDSFMAACDMDRIVRALEAASAKFGVAWQLFLQDEPAGSIADGKRDNRAAHSLQGLQSICRKLGVDPADLNRERVLAEYRAGNSDGTPPVPPPGSAALKKTDVTALRNRWKPREMEAVYNFIRNGSAEPLPFKKINHLGADYEDVRAFHFSERVRDGKATFCDFSYCERSLAGQFNKCEFSDCMFVKASLGTNLGARFTRCNFSDAKLPRAVLNGEFTECSFVRAKLRSAMGKVSLIKCNFDGADLRGVHFLDCKFVECSFDKTIFGGGSLAFSVFEGIDLSKVAFNDTLLEGIECR